jgi:alkanesulfonate monooxygenase SsuD/methylene tetrahydromethanopterin reductase-like flavin-dependent oxidoreductase (luciferase family)
VLSQRDRAVIGGPEKCRRELTALAQRYEADEVMLLTITGDYATRERSYELLAGAFGLAA